MIASSINWDAIAALSGAAGIVLTIYLTWRGGARSIISYAVSHIYGDIDGKDVCASRIVFKNHGPHIPGFKIRIGSVIHVISHRVSNFSTLDKNEAQINIEVAKDPTSDLVLQISELPRGESFIVDVFASYKVYHNEIKGTSAKFLLRERDEFYGRRLVIFLVGLGMSVFLFFVLSR